MEYLSKIATNGQGKKMSKGKNLFCANRLLSCNDTRATTGCYIRCSKTASELNNNNEKNINLTQIWQREFRCVDFLFHKFFEVSLFHPSLSVSIYIYGELEMSTRNVCMKNLINRGVHVRCGIDVCVWWCVVWFKRKKNEQQQIAAHSSLLPALLRIECFRTHKHIRFDRFWQLCVSVYVSERIRSVL